MASIAKDQGLCAFCLCKDFTSINPVLLSFRSRSPLSRAGWALRSPQHMFFPTRSALSLQPAKQAMRHFIHKQK
jgi:hypothetical protein